MEKIRVCVTQVNTHSTRLRVTSPSVFLFPLISFLVLRKKPLADPTRDETRRRKDRFDALFYPALCFFFIYFFLKETFLFFYTCVLNLIPLYSYFRELIFILLFLKLQRMLKLLLQYRESPEYEPERDPLFVLAFDLSCILYFVVQTSLSTRLLSPAELDPLFFYFFNRNFFFNFFPW